MAQSPYSATKTSRIASAAASTNATVAKAASGTLKSVTGYNAAAALRYLKFYDSAVSPTVGTTTIRKSIAIPATTAFHLRYDDYFGQGISYALTTGAADADTGALTAGDVTNLNVDYL